MSHSIGYLRLYYDKDHVPNISPCTFRMLDNRLTSSGTLFTGRLTPQPLSIHYECGQISGAEM